jgi:tetratricopeptide (TPR) repeat protein
MIPVRLLRVLALAGCFSLGLAHALDTAAHAAPAGDADTEAVARQHFQLGEIHYAANEFAAALAEYQAGYDAVPLPGFLVNIAQCQRRMGDLRRARITYQKFVLVAPDSPLVPEVRGLIRELDRQLGGTAALAPPAFDAGRTPGRASGPRGAAGPSATGAAAASAPDGVRLTARSAGTESTAASGDGGRMSSSSRWWLWGTLAVVTLAGVGAIVALSPGGTTTVHDGTLGTLRR